MSEFEIFIFGLVNLAVLLTGLMWALRRVGRHFFFARRMAIGKDLDAAAAQIESAKDRLAKVNSLMENLAADIESRRAAIAERCGKECAETLAAAKASAERLKLLAVGQAHEQRRRAADEARTQLLENAFRIAREDLERDMTPGLKKKFLERGLEELGALKALA